MSVSVEVELSDSQLHFPFAPLRPEAAKGHVDPRGIVGNVLDVDGLLNQLSGF